MTGDVQTMTGDGQGMTGDEQEMTGDGHGMTGDGQTMTAPKSPIFSTPKVAGLVRSEGPKAPRTEVTILP
jgi:hypothetical protein